MIWAARQLLVPCNYLRIRQGDTLFQSKGVYDFVLPAGLTIITLAACLWLSVPLEMRVHPGLVKSLTDLLALLIAFYMAALAAVATFQREGIDLPLKGGDAILIVKHHDGGKPVEKKLSYRQFISYLFGYLAFLSFILYLGLIFFSKGWHLVIEHLSKSINYASMIATIVNPVVFTLIFFALWQLVTTSLLGIYFLADRIQTLSDPEY